MTDSEEREVTSEPAGNPPDIDTAQVDNASGAATPSETDASTQADTSAEMEELLDSLRRERADFVNYRRRIESDRRQDTERAQAETVRVLLPAVDELERAFAQLPPNLREDPWVQGMLLVHRSLVDTLRRLGVVQFGQAGEPFNPEIHEAVSFTRRDDVNDQLLEEVMRPGYRMRDILLRPAQVAVVGPSAAGGAPMPGDAAQADATRQPGARNTGSDAGSADATTESQTQAS